MASDVQDGCRNSKKNNFGTVQHFCVLILHLFFREKHETRAYFIKLVKNAGSIQNGGYKSDFFAQRESSK
jgi:hypothetical protein